MSPRVRWLIAGAAFVGIALAALPLVLALRGRAVARDLHAFLAERVTPRPDCPIADPFLASGLAAVNCYDGRLRGGAPFALIVGSEAGSRTNVYNYVGVYLPGGLPALQTWRDRVRARGDWYGRRVDPEGAKLHLVVGPSQDIPVRADTCDEGGVVVAWRLQVLPSREKVEAFIAEVEASVSPDRTSP